MAFPSTTTTRFRQVGLPDKTQTSLDVVLRCFVEAVNADSGMVLGFDSDTKVVLQAATGHAARRATIPWTPGSFLGRALKSEAPSLEAASGWHKDNGTPGGYLAVASQIVGKNGPSGAIYAGFDRPSPLSRAELWWIVKSHAHLAGLCMSDGGMAVASVLRSSGIDHLTGCLVYERVLEMLDSEVQRSARQGHQLSCCFLDIDHFKAINDEHGHVQGNRVLASAGEALLGSARGFDCVGRFGGDEFVVVMPETSLAEAHKAVTRMWYEVKQAVEESTGLKITASAGVAEWQRGTPMLQLLKASDQSLQAAKAMGGRTLVRGSSPKRRFASFSELVRRARPMPRARPRRKGAKPRQKDAVR